MNNKQNKPEYNPLFGKLYKRRNFLKCNSNFIN